MKKNKIIDSIILDDIGELKVRFSKRAKYARISIDSRGEVTVTIPPQLKFEHVLEFVSSKKEWINKNKKKVKKQKLLKLKLSDNELKKFWRDTEERLFLLSKKYKLDYNQLIFKTLKSRWGSCSSNNVICLNNLLYYLPEYLQEYVMLHELIHTRIKNHSFQFWNELENICKNSKIKRKELRDKYSIG